MGAVYEATDNTWITSIALKTLTHVSGAAIYQIKQEFRTLADLTHPNLVGLNDLGCDNGIWFITMDHVPGDTLLAHARTQPDWGTLRHRFAELALGIGAIHQAGLLHRDLKPSNVMVTPQGRVVILDFGLACQQHEGAAGATLAGSISGTPVYMSPEQASGGKITRASDWYAFGVMLYEILSGKPPFDGGKRDILQAKQRQPAPPLPAELTGVSAQVKHLCMELLRRDPSQRPGFTEVTGILKPPRTQHLGVREPPTRQTFVGRSQELASLRDALDATNADRPVAMLISGPSGVGKTALVTQFLRDVSIDDRALVLRGRCHEHESVPYKTCDSLVDALSRHLCQLSPEQSDQLLPRHAHALARVFPVFSRPEILSRLQPRRPLPPDPVELKSRGQRALKELLGRIAEQKQVVLHVDDAQWSDVDGARLLAFLLGPPDAPPLLLICTFRNEGHPGDSTGLRALFDGLRNKHGVDLREMLLSGLSDDEARLLAEASLPASLAHWATQIAVDSEGSPFFITRAARWASEVHPQDPQDADSANIDTMLCAQVAQLPDMDQELLEAVCVAGRTLDRGLLRKVTGHKDETPALRRLETTQLLRATRDGGDAVAVYHDRVRGAIVRGLDAARLSHWHRRFVQVLDATTNPDALELTRHLLGAGETARVGKTAVDAAKMASAALAFEQAVQLYDLALAHGRWDDDGQAAVLAAKAEALVNGLRAADGGTTFIEAAERTTDQATREDLWRRGGEQLLLSGQIQAGICVLQRVFTAQGLDFDILCAADCGALMHQLLTRGFAFESSAEGAIDPAELRRLETLWSAALGLVHLRYAETFALALRCTIDALDLGAVRYIIRGLMGVSILEAAMAPGQQQIFGLMTHLCNQSDDELASVYLALTEGNIAIFRCQPTRMLEAAVHALDLLEQNTVGRVKERSIARNLVLSAHFQRGDYAALWRVAMPWKVEALQQSNTYLLAWISIYLAIHFLALGESDRARESLAEALRSQEDDPPDVVAVAVGQYSALCDAHEGNPMGWRRITETGTLMGRSELAANPLKQSDQAYFQGLVALRLASGHPEETSLRAAAEQSAALLETMVTPDGRTFTIDYWAPHAKLLRAGLCASRGEHKAALDFLDAALAGFDATDSSASSRACALRRKGQLLCAADSSGTGVSLVQEAEAALVRLGVTDLDGYCDLFSPGFGAPPVA